MKAVKTRPRFRCDYCRKTGMAATIERHERICWQNPDRFCDACNNTGVIEDYIPGAGTKTDPCWYCSQRTVELEPVLAPYDVKFVPR